MKVDITWIPESCNGRLAIMPRPRAGDWLLDELRAWQAEGVTAVLSLLTPLEIFELDLQPEEAVCHTLDLVYLSYPIPDRQVPTSRAATAQLLAQLQTLLKSGHGLAIHCRMGIGRSAMLAASLLRQQGLTTAAAFEAIHKARGREVPDTPAQWRWVDELTFTID